MIGSEFTGQLYLPLSVWMFHDPQKACGCAPAVLTKYQKWISGPLVETSEFIRARVLAARNIHL
jgi:hypothetical protein